MTFEVGTSNPELLSKARQVAESYAATRVAENTMGIVFLGAIARGYFDRDADIDIAIFEQNGKSETRIESEMVDGYEVQTFISDFEHSKTSPWEMSKRWAFSNNIIYFQKEDFIEKLLDAKTCLQPPERAHLMKVGITLAEWYCNRLPELWIRRHDILSAHNMFSEGLNYYFSALYALNNELVADLKWRLSGTKSLKLVPPDLQNRLASFLQVKEVSIGEINRRRDVFLSLWSETLPMIEECVGMKYNDFKNTI